MMTLQVRTKHAIFKSLLRYPLKNRLYNFFVQRSKAVVQLFIYQKIIINLFFIFLTISLLYSFHTY